MQAHSMALCNMCRSPKANPQDGGGEVMNNIWAEGDVTSETAKEEPSE